MATLEQYQEELETIRDNVTALLKLKEKLDEYITETIASITSWDVLALPHNVGMDTFNNNFFDFYFTAFEEIKYQAALALESSKEYNAPPFVDGFLKVFTRDNQFKIVQLEVEDYSTRTFTLRFDLNSVCGTLEDYASGIKAARVAMGRGHSLTTADISVEQASLFWAEKYYGSAREGKPGEVWRGRGEKRTKVSRADKFTKDYWKTIELRISESGKPAPWWRLLDQGNMHVRMSSDIGGKPYPIQPKTDFVQKAVQKASKEIGESWKKDFRDTQKQREDNAETERENLGVAQSLLDEVSKLIDEKNLPEIVKKIEHQLEVFGRESKKNIETEEALAAKIASKGSKERIQISGVRIRTTRIKNQLRAMGIQV